MPVCQISTGFPDWREGEKYQVISEDSSNSIAA